MKWFAKPYLVRIAAALGHFVSGLLNILGEISRRLKQSLDEPWEIACAVILTIAGTLGVFFLLDGPADIWIKIGGLGALSAGLVGIYAPKESRLRDIAPELIGISIGVVFIDQLYQIRFVQQQKQEIISQMGSPSNAFALEAIRLARIHGWLADGTLNEIDLGGANLQEAPLANANLEGVTFVGTNLENAQMQRANLQEAVFDRAMLNSAAFDNARLLNASFSRANLSNATLTNAALSNRVVPK